MKKVIIFIIIIGTFSCSKEYIQLDNDIATEEVQINKTNSLVDTLSFSSSSSSITYSSSGSISYKTKFYFADIDGDGKSEKVYWKYDKYSGDLRVFEDGLVYTPINGGSYSWFRPTAIQSSGSSSNETEFYFSDINGDNKADKIYWNYDNHGGDVRVFLATNGNTFSSTAIHSSGSSSNKTKFYFTDINGDGKSDKIYWKYDKYGGDIKVYLATSSGNFSSTAVSSSGSSSNVTKFYFADVDGDGKSDKIYWKRDKYGGDIRVFLATSSGNFNSTAVHSSGSVSDKTKFYFADVNGDGKSDKIYWKYDKYGGDVRVFFSNVIQPLNVFINFSNSLSMTFGNSSSSTTHWYFSKLDSNSYYDRVEWDIYNNSGDLQIKLN